MKKLIYLSMIAIVTITSFAFKPTSVVMQGTYTVDTKKTKAVWLAKKVTGEHTGNITFASGSVQFDGKHVTGGTFEFDMNSITNTDLTDKGYNDKLIGHLKSEDFFSVAKFSTAKFVITKVVPKSGDNYDVTGNLTIKGITNEITFPAVIKATPARIITVAKITINRTKFDIKYGSASFIEGIGDKAINDDFTLDIEVLAFPDKTVK
jgi:polyisoprenoid-binding protein YceI